MNNDNNLPHNKLFNDNYKYIDNTFHKLIKKYKIKCYDTVEDIRQDCYIALLKRLKKYNPEKSNIETYIGACIYYIIPSVISEGQKKYFYSKNEDNFPIYNDLLEDFNSNFEENLIIQLLLDDIHDMIDDPTLQTVFEMKRKGFQNQEIAKHLNVSNATITRYMDKIKKISMKIFSETT